MAFKNSMSYTGQYYCALKFASNALFLTVVMSEAMLVVVGVCVAPGAVLDHRPVLAIWLRLSGLLSSLDCGNHRSYQFFDELRIRST